MPRYVAFLRAINVGGHTVKMAALRGHFEGIGLSGVETFIASGNVVFDTSSKNADALERKIEARLLAALGYEVATFLRTPSELGRVIAARPFAVADMNAAGHALHIAFLADTPSGAAKKQLAQFATNDDAFHVAGREVFWLRRGRMSDSKFSGAILEKTLGMPATLRNATTVRKIVAAIG